MPPNEPFYDDTEEHLRLVEAANRGRAEYPTWEAMIRRVGDRYDLQNESLSLVSGGSTRPTRPAFTLHRGNLRAQAGKEPPVDAVLHTLTQDTTKLRLGRRDNLDLEDLIWHEPWQAYLKPKKWCRLINFLRCVIACSAMLVLVVYSTPARALELSSGVSLGGVQVGTAPRLAVSPNMRILWRMDDGPTLAIHDLLNILPPINGSGFGVYNHTSAAFGYAWSNGYLDVGPSFSIYSMMACGTNLCGRVTGLSPGGQVQASLYFTGPLGASVSVNVDWVGGSSLILPGGVAAMIVAGPVLRWGLK